MQAYQSQTLKNLEIHWRAEINTHNKYVYILLQATKKPWVSQQNLESWQAWEWHFWDQKSLDREGSPILIRAHIFIDCNKLCSVNPQVIVWCTIIKFLVEILLLWLWGNYIHSSLAKKGPWAVHLTLGSNKRVGWHCRHHYLGTTNAQNSANNVRDIVG